MLRYTLHGRRREMGLGGFAEISLKQAREFAAHWRGKGALGIDPIKLRDTERQDEVRNLHLLNDVALDAFERRKADLKGDGKAGRWFSPLELHILPKLGKLPVAAIIHRDIHDALPPIWHDKRETARKAIGRLSIVRQHDVALGRHVDLRSGRQGKDAFGHFWP